jgi:hypothetical protein
LPNNEYNQASQPVQQKAPEHVHTVTTVTQDVTVAPTPAPALVVEEKRVADQQRRLIYGGYGI